MPTTQFPLEGKVALVTGSGRGMGRQHALELASRGANVVINYSSPSSSAAANEAVNEIVALREGAKAIAIQADLSNPTQIESLFTQSIQHFGKLDIVVSNAGVEHFYPNQNILDVTPEQFDRTFAINTKGQFFVAQQAYKHLGQGGKLILSSSISAQARGVKYHAVYAGSKAAIEAFTRSFATDFGDKGITVNAVAPGGVKTDMYIEAARKYIPGAEGDENGVGRWSDEKVDQAVANFTPLKRPGYPDDISKVIAFLASEDAGWINGQVIGISGGAAM